MCNKFIYVPFFHCGFEWIGLASGVPGKEDVKVYVSTLTWRHTVAAAGETATWPVSICLCGKGLLRPLQSRAASGYKLEIRGGKVQLWSDSRRLNAYVRSPECVCAAKVQGDKIREEKRLVRGFFMDVSSRFPPSCGNGTINIRLKWEVSRREHTLRSSPVHHRPHTPFTHWEAFWGPWPTWRAGYCSVVDS